MPQLAHLIVGIFEKMIESLNANETEPWIFHIGHDVERDGQGSCKEHHVCIQLCPALAAIPNPASSEQPRPKPNSIK